MALRCFLVVLLSAAMVLEALAPLQAHWPKHDTPGVGGKPDLTAPAPKTADGKPDLSGVWQVRQGSYLVYVTSDLKPEDILPWAAAAYKKSADNFRRDSDGIRCLPPGPKAGISGLAFPMKIVQTPNLVVVLYEYETIFRQIFLDDRALPPDPNPTWMGYSVGHWEGDTLVVTTAGYNDKTTLDLGGHPHTEALRVTERFHRRDAGHIDLQVTLDDPKAYARPWTLPIELALVADGELIEYVCENELDVLARYVGTYDSTRFPGRTVVSLEGNQLMINTTGAGNIPLVAHGENSFTMEGTGIEFVKDPGGAVIALLQHWAEGDRYEPRRK